ncbi:MAG TPA: hypothetical protein VK811_05370 [Candidatus Acidoferrum sp.]|nr:hypothetical protein [Candidatus Acidoferrum sp.]
MNCSVHKKIGVLGESPGDRYRTLFATLAQIYPVEFRRISSFENEVVDAVLVLDGRVSEAEAAAARGIPAYVIVSNGEGKNHTTGPEMRFGTSDSLDLCLRGQTMTETATGPLPALSVKPGDEVLAYLGERPILINRTVGASYCQITTAPLPLLAQNELLFQHLSEGCFLGLLPLINFLRQAVRDTGWQDAPIQTCFVFDDPSLYWPSYGFLDYRLLAELAAQQGLFISVATIPLDTWWVNRAVAATFRSFSPRLSVIMHGNNHTAYELLAEKGSAGHLENAAQAMSRIERLQERHGLAGFKIMEAPHGAISRQMMGHLMSLGYEAVLCTPGLLVQHNPGVAWPATLGLDRADFPAGGGLPAISRIKMTANWKNEAILAALLRKPFVIAGHHWDVADGYKLLEEISKTISGLGCLTWGSPQDIARNNYKHMRNGDALSLKLYGRHIRVSLPEGVKRLFIHRPWLQPGNDTENLVVAQSGLEIFRGNGGSVIGPIPIDAAGVLDISSHLKFHIDFRTVKTPRTEGWPVVRKILMEMRDRSSPVRYQAMRWIQGAKAKPPGKTGDY